MNTRTRAGACEHEDDEVASVLVLVVVLVPIPRQSLCVAGARGDGAGGRIIADPTAQGSRMRILRLVVPGHR